MRLFFAGLGIIYCLVGWFDSQFISNSKTPSIESDFPEGIPNWIKTSKRIGEFDSTD